MGNKQPTFIEFMVDHMGDYADEFLQRELIRTQNELINIKENEVKLLQIKGKYRYGKVVPYRQKENTDMEMLYHTYKNERNDLPFFIHKTPNLVLSIPYNIHR